MSKLLYPITEKPFDLTYEQWSIEWWKWILNIPKERNPFLDTSGRNANTDQKYSNVIFLCQTFNAVEKTPLRHIVVQEGICIFMPLINWISIMPDDGNTDEELINVAKEKMDVVQQTTLWLNDIKINGMDYRARTPPFYVNLPKNNILNKKEQCIKIVSDGYWIFTTPIVKPSFLNTFGTCSKGVTKISINYFIDIKKCE